MTRIATARPTIQRPEAEYLVDDAQLAAAAFLARYSGRTLDAYRHDLRGFSQWAADNAIPVLDATRPHIELYRAWMEQRGLAASTIDRRLSTVCGFYRFAHIDGRIGSNPAQYVRRPPVHPSDARGLDRSELGVFLFTAEQYDQRPHGACRAPGAQRVYGSARRAPPTSRILASNEATAPCASSAGATGPPPSRSCPAPRAPSTLPSANATRGRSCYSGPAHGSPTCRFPTKTWPSRATTGRAASSTATSRRSNSPTWQRSSSFSPTTPGSR